MERRYVYDENARDTTVGLSRESRKLSAKSSMVSDYRMGVWGVYLHAGCNDLNATNFLCYIAKRMSYRRSRWPWVSLLPFYVGGAIVGVFGAAVGSLEPGAGTYVGGVVGGAVGTLTGHVVCAP